MKGLFFIPFIGTKGGKERKKYSGRRGRGGEEEEIKTGREGKERSNP